MPGKHYSEQVPQPSHFAALRGPLRVEVHDNWPDMYQISGTIPGEEDWEWVEPENEAHMALRAAAMHRLPNMLVELQEAYDLLLDMSDRGEIDGPDCTDEEGTPDKTGLRLWTLMQRISMTLQEIEQRGIELGLQQPPASPSTAEPAQRNEETTDE